MTTTRHKNLRQKLNAMGYRQPLSLESVSLVERLLKDIVRFSEAHSPLKDGKDPEKLLVLLKSENAHLLQENNRLHQALMNRFDPPDSSTYEYRNKIRKLENENNDLKFLNSQYLSKIQEMEKDISEKSKKLLFLHEKANPIIRLHPQEKGSKKKTSAFVHQKMELESPLPKSRFCFMTSSSSPPTSSADDTYVADMLVLADKRNNQLRSELDEANSCIDQLNNNIQNLESKLKTRDQEIERLNRQMLMGYSNSYSHVPSNSDYVQLWNKVEDIEKSREELQKDLRSACEVRRELEAKCIQLSMHNKELQEELHKLISINNQIQEDKDRMLQASYREMDKHYEVNQLKCELDRKETILHDQEVEILALQNEKGILRDKINQLLTSETQLLDEIWQLKQSSVMPQPKKNVKKGQFAKTTSIKSNEIKLLEMQRDFYKRRADDLTRFMSLHQDGCCLHSEQGHHSDAEERRHRYRSPLSHPSGATSSKFSLGRRAVTPPPRLNPTQKQRNFKSRSLSPKGRSVTICHKNPVKDLTKPKATVKKICPTLAEQQINHLKEERDFYQKQYEKLRSEKLKRNISPPVKEKDYCMFETQKLREEKNELQKKCLRLEEQLQKRIKELSDEKTELQRLHLEAEHKRRLLEQERSVGQTLAERSMLRSLERENEQLSRDCKNATLERDVLRDKLKIATETQIAERKRLENAITLLERKLNEQEKDFAELHMEKNRCKKQITQLQEQIHQLELEVASANDNTIHQQAIASQIQKLADQTQKQLEETKHKLAVKEASGIENYVKKMEEEINELTLKNMQQKNDMDNLRRTVTVIDREKDQLQTDVDIKSERLASLEIALKHKDNMIKDLKVTINTLETTLKRQQEENFAFEKNMATAQRQLETFEREIQSNAKVCDHHLHQIQILKDDLATMTRENQRLHNELDKAVEEEKQSKKQIQNYINEVSKIESLLKMKEQERLDMFAQFRNITEEASTLETQNNQLESETASYRLELHSKNVEIQHLQNVLANLQQEVEQYIAAQQNLELELTETRHNMKLLEEEKQKYRQERDDLQQDISTVRSLCSEIDSKNEFLCRQLADKEEECNELKQNVKLIESQLTVVQDEVEDKERKIQDLENLLSSNRSKEFQTHLSIQGLRTELEQAQDQLRDSEHRLVSMSEECSTYRAKVSSLELEIDQLRHQLTNEKFEKERLNQECRRLKLNISSSPESRIGTSRQRLLSPILSENNELEEVFGTDRHSYRYSYDRLYSGRDVLQTQDHDKILTEKKVEDRQETNITEISDKDKRTTFQGSKTAEELKLTPYSAPKPLRNVYLSSELRQEQHSSLPDDLGETRDHSVDRPSEK